MKKTLLYSLLIIAGLFTSCEKEEEVQQQLTCPNARVTYLGSDICSTTHNSTVNSRGTITIAEWTTARPIEDFYIQVEYKDYSNEFNLEMVDRGSAIPSATGYYSSRQDPSFSWVRNINTISFSSTTISGFMNL